MFTEAEIAYLAAQRLGRLATVGPAGDPHNVPVGVHYNAELGTIDIAGIDLGKSRKYRDVLRDPRVAFVVDDADPGDPMSFRGMEIRGTAQALSTGGKAFNDAVADELIRITPTRVITWGIDEHWTAGARSRSLAKGTTHA